MSYATEVLKVNPQVTFFLAIETVGWLTTPADYSSGFDGTIFSTGDPDGDLLTRLGATTLHKTLFLPENISDSVDALTFKYSPAALTFKLNETEDDYLATVFKQNWNDGQVGSLNAALEPGDTEPFIDNADATWNTGDVIYVAGREAVLLGTKTLVSGTVYKYTGSTRGYLGAIVGRKDAKASIEGAFSWGTATTIHNYNRHWHNRRVQLFALARGESVGNAVRLYVGKLRGMKNMQLGLFWRFVTVSSGMSEGSPIRSRPAGQILKHNTLSGPISNVVTTVAARAYRIFNCGIHRSVQFEAYENLASAFSYDYRNRVRGGTRGVYNSYALNDETPQARQNAAGQYLNWSMIDVGNHFLRAHRAADYTDGHDTVNHRRIRAQAMNLETFSGFFDLINWDAENTFPNDTPIAFTLDNRNDVAVENWFTVNNLVRRNIIDVVLMFLTSMDDEFWIGDAEAAGTTTSLVATAAAPGWAVNEWTGYALHCVEGTNIGESRLIVSNTSGVLTTDAFTNATETGKEYQIRSSIYDVLPIGWGVQMTPPDIDIAAWEVIRDRFFAGIDVGKFIISSREQIDIMQLLGDNIFQPYGILPIYDRSTGKIAPRYVEAALQDELFDTAFVNITPAQILKIGDVNLMASKALASITLKVRGKAKVLKPVFLNSSQFGGGTAQIVRYEEAMTGTQPALSGASEELLIKGDLLDAAYIDEDLSNLTVQALFDDRFSSVDLIARMRARFLRAGLHPPVVPITVDFSLVDRIQTGDTIILEKGLNPSPPNPFTTGKGWSGQLGIVLSSSMRLVDDVPGLELNVQLWPQNVFARVAPALNVTGKGSDASGDYFSCSLHDFDPDSEIEDWDLFTVDDEITLFDITGAAKETEKIKGFGSPIQTVVDDADSAFPRVYVDGTIAVTIAVGDYITFSSWDSPTNNTNNKDKFTALADAAATLGSNNDVARIYF